MAEKEEKEEDSVYDKEGREKLVEEGEMSPEEAGFMKGYEEADKEKKDKAKPKSKEEQEEDEKVEETLRELDSQKEDKQ